MDIIKKICESPHKDVIDTAIEQGYTPSLVREGLVRQGVDQYSLKEIETYMKHYYQTVLSKSLEDYSDLSGTLENSVSLALLDHAEFDRKLTYQALLELDVLRAEKMIQDVLAGKSLPCNIDTFKKLCSIKQSVISSVSTFIQYKQAITQAKNITQTAKLINMDRLGPYINNLASSERSIVLDVLNIVMDSQNDRLIDIESP